MCSVYTVGVKEPMYASNTSSNAQDMNLATIKRSVFILLTVEEFNKCLWNIKNYEGINKDSWIGLSDFCLMDIFYVLRFKIPTISTFIVTIHTLCCILLTYFKYPQKWAIISNLSHCHVSLVCHWQYLL